MTPEKYAILKLAEGYGASLDLSGPRISSTTKQIARDCMAEGLLSGLLRSVSLTDKGRAALADYRAQRKQA